MKKSLFVILMTVAVFFSVSSQAALHSKDDPVFGPDSITLDDATGLEWLELTASDWLTYDYVRSQFGPGGQFEGWRHATTLEVNELAINAGITINIGSTGANFEPVSEFIGLINSSAQGYAFGFVANAGRNAGLRTVYGSALVNGSQGYAGVAFEMPDNYSEFGLSHFLVRKGATPDKTFRFEGRLQSGQRFEVSYTFNPGLAQVSGGTNETGYSQLFSNATITVDGVTVPAGFQANSSFVSIQNNMVADQNYDRYQAILQFSPTVHVAGLNFDRIYLYAEDATVYPEFSNVLGDTALITDSSKLFSFPLLAAGFQLGGAPAIMIPVAPVTTDYDEATGGDIPSNLPLRHFDLEVGVNKISGSEFVDSNGGFDVESMAFSVPEGSRLESIEYDYDYSFEPGAGSLQRVLTLWQGTFTQQLASRTVVFLFTQNPSIEDVSPVSVFGSALPLPAGEYVFGGGGGIGHEGGWTGTRSWNYTLRFIVRKIASPLTSPPTIEPIVIGEGLGQNGWYRNNVDLYWKVEDETGVTSRSGCRAVAVTSDNGGATYTCMATSAGGTAIQSYTLKRDGTRPIVNVMFGPLPNGNGWNKSNVTVSFEGTDPEPGSGIAQCSVPRVLSSEGINQAAFGQCSDFAGNFNSNGVTDIRIDKTLPSATLSVPQQGAIYPAGVAVNADYSCSDALSGILACNAPAANGATIDTAAIGAKTFTLTAIDFAGNISTVSAGYTVSNPALPLYVLSANALAFGERATSAAGPGQAITVTNSGLVALPISNITRTGTNANQFAHSHNCGTSLPAGASCTINVTFLPTTAGVKVASLNVIGGGGSSTKVISLTGTGVLPTYSLTPVSLAFGNQATNVASSALTIELTNTGSVSLAISSITRTGTNANQFSQTSDCGASLDAESTCTINVVFLPTSVGVKAATLNVNTGGGAGTKTVSLAGTGVVPTYSLLPGALDFGSQPITVLSDAQFVTLRNTGVLPLPISTIAFVGGNANQFVQSNNCPASIAPDGVCAITVRFLPTSVGAKTTRITVTAGGGAAAQSINLTGTGIPPTYSLSTSALVFGNQARSVSSAPQIVTLSNPGPAALAITSVTRTGTNANQFLLTNNCPPTVAANASCTVEVVFLPTSVGAKTALLNVNTGGGAGTKSVSLTGVGIVPTYSLSPTSLGFASQGVNTNSASQSVTVTNTGELPLPITSITRAGTNGNQFSQTNDCGASLAVGATCNIDVVFRPTTAGAKVATLNVVGGAGAATTSVGLTGTGIVPTYTLPTTPLDFGTQLRNTSSSPQVITLTNTGTLDLPITSISFTGTNANQFQQTNDCGSNLVVGGACSIAIVFRPTSAGAKTASARLVLGGGAVTPATIPVTGTGT